MRLLFTYFTLIAAVITPGADKLVDDALDGCDALLVKQLRAERDAAYKARDDAVAAKDAAEGSKLFPFFDVQCQIFRVQKSAGECADGQVLECVVCVFPSLSHNNTQVSWCCAWCGTQSCPCAYSRSIRSG